MTFTEAAVEILRRAGKPLHFNEIAASAVRENLLSHVGQDPEAIMGQRLAAMARREEDRKVVAIEPEGTFALTEWKVAPELVMEPVAPPAEPAEALEAPYRAKEREPRPIHAQARRRLEALQGIAPEEDEQKQRGGQRGDRDRERQGRRFALPAEAAFEWLAARGTGAPLSELAEALGKKGLVSEGLSHDPASLSTALLEDNRRRTEAGRKPAFIVDGERVTLVEFPPPGAPIVEEARSPQTALGRPSTAAQLVAEGRRATVRALRARLGDLETSAYEQVCSALLEKMGMRDVRVAKRSKDGPLYLARHRQGLSDLRVAIRLVRGRREIGRADVQELRKDLAHYSQQMGLVLAPGEVGRDARGEASAAGQPPVALFAGEALAEELVTQRVGVTVQTVEISDIDEAFFANAAKASPQHARDRREGESRTESALVAEAGAQSIPEGVSPEVAPALETAAPEIAAPADPGRRPRQEDRSRQQEPRRGPVRLTTPADQAWGQPAGTPKKSLLLAALGDTRPSDPAAVAQAEPSSTPAASANPETAPLSPAEVAPPAEEQATDTQTAAP